VHPDESDIPFTPRLDRTDHGAHRDTITCILPIVAMEAEDAVLLASYLNWLTGSVETIVVDGSPPAIFTANHTAWQESIRHGLRHVPPAIDLATPMGKVGSVLTGVRLASNERLIIADDDVRYDDASLARVARALDRAEVVRPQNYFQPLPWHACWDTARILLNRVAGGDWPGTLAVQRSVLRATGGYDGRALFENLELVRTVRAAGGRELVLFDAFVRRQPAGVRHFWSQRVRQAYDEFARPARLAAQLSILPLLVVLAAGRHGWVLAFAAFAAMVAAEFGRRRGGGTRVFPAAAVLFAPAWLAERAVCSWLALGSRVVLGGIRYHGVVLRHAATSMRVLTTRHAAVRQERALQHREAQPGPAPELRDQSA
jgi:hypothetical protein